MKKTRLLASFALATLSAVIQPATVRADTFGSGANSFTIDFVDIGNAANRDDLGEGGGIYSSPYGGVAYNYRMGVTEVPQVWIDKATNLGMANVVAGAWSGNQPAANMTWYEMAEFVNWLNTTTGHHRAYDLTWTGSAWSMNLWSSAEAWQMGGRNLYRHKDAYYFLPSEDEWYKAAFHKNDGPTANYWDYATASNSIPIPVAGGQETGTAVYNGGAVVAPAAVHDDGGLSPYGTRGQGGNILELLESSSTGLNDSVAVTRVVRGGYFSNVGDVNLRSTYRASSIFGGVTASFSYRGFRVASVSGPDTTTSTPMLMAPASGSASTNMVAVAFYLPEAALSGSVKLTFTGSVMRVLTLTSVNDSVGTHAFTLNALNPLPSAEIADGSPIPDGIYTVVLSYQDALGNPTASSTPALNVTVNLDTDGDEVLDKYETGTGIYVSPTNTGTSLTNPDTDGDGLTDGQEVNIYHSNPNLPDTDGDGFDDGFEVTTGFSPTSAASTPDALSSIRTAAEYRFNAANGISYRIEAFTDFTNWSTIETNIIGSGGVITRFYSIEGQPRRFFRSRRN